MEKIFGFAMVLARVCAFFLAGPVFGFAALPVMVRAAAAVVLSVFFGSIVQVPAAVGRLPMAGLLLVFASEAAYGLLLGLVVHMIFASVALAGQVIEQQMGFTTAEMVDPLTGQDQQPLAMILEMIFLLLLLASDGHQLLVRALSRSLQGFPPGRVPDIATMVAALVKGGSAMLLMGLRLASPILVAFLLLYTVLAIFSRVVPEMDILLLTFPARIGLGLVLTVLLIPAIQELVWQLGVWMARLLPL